MKHWSRAQRAALIAATAAVCALLCVLLLQRAAARAGQAPGRLELLPDAAPTPPPSMSFVEDAAQPMLEEGCRFVQGSAFTLSGEVRANRPLTGVTVTIDCAYNSDPFYPYRSSVYFPEGSAVYTCRLDQSEGTLEGASIASRLDLAQLRPGVHTLRLIASCEGAKSVELLRVRFFVLGDAWEQLVPEDFNDSYAEALAFFGEEARFCYRYQWVDGRYTMADPDWEEAYITTVAGLPEGETWRVHVDAAPYFERALAYLRGTYVRVSGTNGDSGVIPLASLVATYDGCYVSRFTSSLRTVSHHAFGTAVDLNASMQPNLNTAENIALIDGEVGELLAYNGIRQEGGVSYYDYTYSGSCAALLNGVPETVVNYLLYELAFYRAGFLWAHYYRSTSDGMHFTLSEFVTRKHDDGRGLRKVYEYIEPAPAA